MDTTAHTDTQLADAARHGCATSLARLCTRWQPAAAHIAASYRWAGDPDDLAQTALTGMISALRDGKGPTRTIPGYLRTAIRNAATRAWRQQQHTTTGYDLDLTPAHPAPGTLAGPATTAYLSLPARWQRILRLTVIDGMTPTQAGQIMSLTPAGAAQLACRARAGLRRAFAAAHANTPTPVHDTTRQAA